MVRKLRARSRSWRREGGASKSTAFKPLERKAGSGLMLARINVLTATGRQQT
jgi:hypothetical protein